MVLLMTADMVEGQGAVVEDTAAQLETIAIGKDQMRSR